MIILVIGNQLLFSQCQVVFPKKTFKSEEYEEWEKKYRSKLSRYYAGQSISSISNFEQAKMDALSDLSSSISTEIIQELEMHTVQSKDEILVDLIKENIKLFSKNKIKDSHTVVEKDDKTGYTVHVFKCKDEVEQERKTQNEDLKFATEKFSKRYEKKFYNKEYSSAFENLCEAYLFASSIDNINVLLSSGYHDTKEKLERFLSSVNISLSKNNIYVIRSVPSSDKLKISGFYKLKNRTVKLSNFKLKAHIIGVSDWINNELLIDLGTNGNKSINLPTIYSYSEKATINFIPELDILNESSQHNITRHAKRNLIDLFKQYFNEKEKRIDITVKRDYLPVRFNPDEPGYYDCSPPTNRLTLLTKIKQSFVYLNRIKIEDKLGYPDLKIIIRPSPGSNTYYNFTAKILIDGVQIGDKSEKEDIANIKPIFFKDLIEKLYSDVTQSSIDGELSKDISLKIRSQAGKTYDISSSEDLPQELENDKYFISFMYKGKPFLPDTTIFLKGDINFTDWFGGQIKYKRQKIRITYNIFKPIDKSGLQIKWNNESEIWDGDNGGFGRGWNTLIGENDKSNTLTFKKDGWKTFKKNILINDFRGKSQNIAVDMEKIKMGVYRNLVYLSFPGSSQFDLYKTSLKRKLIVGLGLFFLAGYFTIEGINNYQDYMDYKQGYKEAKSIYESLSELDNTEEFDIYNQNAKFTYDKMEKSYNKMQRNVAGVTLVYSINLIDLIRSYYKFSRQF